jgi:hypothetical protein
MLFFPGFRLGHGWGDFVARSDFGSCGGLGINRPSAVEPTHGAVKLRHEWRTRS